jgi:hypothetical protein
MLLNLRLKGLSSERAKGSIAVLKCQDERYPTQRGLFEYNLAGQKEKSETFGGIDADLVRTSNH